VSHRRFFGIAGAIVALDQLTKGLVLSMLPEGSSIPVIPGILLLTHVRNPGTAFGLLRESGPILTIITLAAIAFIVSYWLYVRRSGLERSPLLFLGLALPLGGAMGNLADRIRLKHVVDFIDFRVWPVFNVADSAITIGACLVAYYFFVIQEARAPAGDVAPSAE
jgi:signal peptidase II